MAGDWRAGPGTDLADLLTPFAARLAPWCPSRCSGCAAWSTGASPATSENTLEGSRSNISRPLRPQQRAVRRLPRPDDDLLLGAGSTRASPLAGRARLEEAQLRKIDGILDLAGVRAGTRVLEIGTGWGDARRSAPRSAAPRSPR